MMLNMQVSLLFGSLLNSVVSLAPTPLSSTSFSSSTFQSSAAKASRSGVLAAISPVHGAQSLGMTRSRSGTPAFQLPTSSTRPSSTFSTTRLGMLRGGSSDAAVTATSSLFSNVLAKFGTGTPQTLFNTTLLGLAMLTLVAKVWQKIQADAAAAASSSTTEQEAKPKEIQSLQLRFLIVFWLLRCSDWLQGPYFYEVYSSKIFNGAPASMALVSRLFLTGFASTALFGPLVGRAADQYGRKKATLAFCLIYALGALSTGSSVLTVLLLGRVLSGIGTSLLFSAPESWLVGAAQSSQKDPTGRYLGETFGLAYAGDSLVAIAAGQLAGAAASQSGPTGPFRLSSLVLALGGILTAFLWKENVASSGSSNADDTEEVDDAGVPAPEKPGISEAIRVIREDSKISLMGAVQSLFEAAMYIFVLQWPPAITNAVQAAFGGAAKVPFGTVFSCFMASCLLGSTLFGQLAKMQVPTETSSAFMLSAATAAMAAATFTISSAPKVGLASLVAAFCAFEACVGMYFPSIGTLRSKYIPDSHRSVIMNIFGIPLNVLVVTVFLSIDKLGLVGALSVSTGALGIAALSMLQLIRSNRKTLPGEASA